MVNGTIKNKSKIGWLNISLLLICPIIIWMLPFDTSQYRVSVNLKEVFLDNHYHYTNVLFSKFLGLSEGTTFFFYEKLEVKIQSFISFAYLYHYLNWFSKTTVIKWHKTISPKSGLVIGVLWVIMLSLFYFNYRIGFLIALIFSFLHLIMEFPLNIKSINTLLRKVRPLKKVD